METSTERQLPESNNLMQVESAHVPPENMLNEELETLTIASIQTLKKCGKDKVFELVNNSLEKEISREIFESLLYQLTEKQSVKSNPSSTKNAIKLLALEAKKLEKVF